MNLKYSSYGTHLKRCKPFWIETSKLESKVLYAITSWSHYEKISTNAKALIYLTWFDGEHGSHLHIYKNENLRSEKPTEASRSAYVRFQQVEAYIKAPSEDIARQIMIREARGPLVKELCKQLQEIPF